MSSHPWTPPLARALALLALAAGLACSAGAPEPTTPPPKPAAPPPRPPRPTPPPPPAPYEELTFTLKQRTQAGQVEEVLRYTSPVGALAARDIDLFLDGTPMGGYEGTEPVGMHTTATLRVEGEERARADLETRCGPPDRCVVRQWLEIALGGHSAPRTVDQVLFDVSEARYPAPYRRYAIAVLPSAVGDAELRRQVRHGEARLRVETRREEVRRLQRAKGAAQEAAVKRLREIDPAPQVGFLINLRFAIASDELTARLAQAAGVQLVRPVPRVLITTMSAPRPRRLALRLDQRLDEVHTVDESGAAVSMPRFHLARSLAGAFLESVVLRQITRRPVTTTATLMDAVARDRIGLVRLRAEKPERIAALRLPDHVVGPLQAALARGRDVGLPLRQPLVLGRKRWGWWVLDPITGRLSGELAHGDDQVMAELDDGPDAGDTLDERAYALALHAGVNAALYSVARDALVVTAWDRDMAADLSKDLAQIPCAMCPDATAQAAVRIVVSECLTRDLFDDDGSFCDAYHDAFSCAAGSVLTAIMPELPERLVSRAGAVMLGCGRAQP